jgi:hypothetical protein
MNVIDAVGMAAGDGEHVGPCVCQVAGIDQQAHCSTGVLHEQIDLALRLDDGAHVMVISKRHTALGHPFRGAR